MFARLRDDEPLQTMAYTLFGLLYVLWLFNFTTKIVYLTPRSSNGLLTGQFYVLYLIAVTKFSDMGAYLTGSVIGRHLMVPHISAKKTWEGFFGAIVFALFCSLALFKLMPGICPRSRGRTGRYSDWFLGSQRALVIWPNQLSSVARMQKIRGTCSPA